MKNKKKAAAACIAVEAAVIILMSGTFAWQSISQTALNEISANINPGGRLHDDFTDVTTAESETMEFDKDVYVENFTRLADNGVQVFARVRLDEYMEKGKGAGLLNADGTISADNHAESVVEGAKLEDRSTWTTHRYEDAEDPDNPFHQYWTWEFGGKTVYMPTFNKNKDSLEADGNGSSEKGFTDYIDYGSEDHAEAEKYAVYDADEEETTDEVVENQWTAKDLIDGDGTLPAELEGHVELKQELHRTKETKESILYSMEEWLALEEDEKIGDYWVYDTDGWAYWASPIDPDTATGLLLTGLRRTDAIINQDWYYGIHVVAQFITGDDLGRTDDTGFYDLSQGGVPSEQALHLLETIGVDVTAGTR